MIALEEKLQSSNPLRRKTMEDVVFDVDKIDKALHKAADKVMDVTPLVENASTL